MDSSNVISTPIGILLGNVVCKEEMKVELAKIKVILDLKPHFNPKKVKSFLGHIGYYSKSYGINP